MHTPIRSLGMTFAAALALAACSESTEPVQPVENDTMPAATGDQSAMAMPGALGLTMQQLNDADVLDPEGRDIGEVERVETDADGNVTMLIVEVEDSEPDMFVQLPLDGLTAVTQGDDYGVQGDFDRDALMNMEQATMQPMAG